MRQKQNPKGSVTPVLLVVFAVIAGLIFATSATGGSILNIKESVDIYNRYFTTAMDKEVESLKQGFVKTAAFFSLNSLTKEFSENGGYAERTLVDANNNGIADKTQGKVPNVTVKQNLPLWTIPNCENVLKRVPYLRDTDPNLPALNRLLLIIPNDNDHKQYIEEINAGTYPLYVSILVLMTKEGTLKVECGPEDGCVEMERLGSTPVTIDKDGIYKYKIKKIDGSKTLTMLNVTGRNSTNGIDHVAQIKHVLASIYDPDAVIIPNVVFTEYLNEYQASMKNTLDERNAKSDIKLTVAPLKGIVTRGNNDSTEGIVWPDEAAGGIKAEVKDVIGGNALLSQIQNSGLVTEEAKIRYYKLYSYAEKFTDSSQQLFQSRLWDMLHNLNKNGHSLQSVTLCGVPISCDKNYYCKDDEVISYTRDDIYNSITSTIENIETEYNTQTSGEGITWEIKYSNNDFSSTFPQVTNLNKDACAAAEQIDVYNFEYVEYIRRDWINQGTSTECSKPWADNPGFTEGNCGVERRWCYLNECRMHYDRRYILKNMNISVKITDNDYKLYDAKTNSWVKQTFQFYITVPIVDMNCCGGDATSGHSCVDHTTACVNQYGSLSVSDTLTAASSLKITSGPDAIDTKDNTAVIKWFTNIESTSKVKYSKTSGGPYTDVADTSKVAGHAITISGLDVSTTYYFVVESSVGSKTVESGEKSFVTGADQTYPTLEFTKPTKTELESKMSPVFNIELVASDNDAINRIELYLYKGSAKTVIDTLTTSPYTYEINISKILSLPPEKDLTGKYIIEAVAYDNIGLNATKSIAVTVNEYADVTIDITKTTMTSTTAFLEWTTLRSNSGTFKYCLDTDCVEKSFADLIEIPGDGGYKGKNGYADYNITISGLTPRAIYLYNITVPIPMGTPKIYEGTFTPIDPPPAISGVAATGITSSGATIGWNTDTSADCNLDITLDLLPGYGSTGTAHSVAVTGLLPSTMYSYTITCTRNPGDSDPSTYNGEFTTLS